MSTERGALAFAVGDRIAFLSNDPQLGVKNGTQGTVTSLKGGILRVRLKGTKGLRTLSVDPQSYKHLDQGYAMTVHKAQGVKVDRAFVLASGHFDRHTSYVALTRPQEAVQLHYSKEELGTFESLRQNLSRTRL